MGLDRESVWVVDVEGNGGSPPEIVELAMIQVSALTVTRTVRHYYIQPASPITDHAMRIHGITDEDVSGAPSFADIQDDILTWLEGASIVGHNVKVEVDILERSLPEWSPVRAFDTLRLSRAVLPSLKSHSLVSVGNHLGFTAEAQRLSGRTHHSALFDATLAAMIFVELTKHLLADGRSDVVNEADILRGRQGSFI